MNWQTLGLIILLAFNLVACVGPTTPFGALESTDKPTPDRNPTQYVNKRYNYQIQFHPERQVLHDKSDLSVEIKADHPIPKDLQFQVFHNGYDVTQNFLDNSTLHSSNDGRTRIYTIKNFRLKTLDRNNIEVRLIEKSLAIYEQNWLQPPECSLFEKRKLAHLGAFHAPEDYIGLIERVAATKEANPSFLAGIVAQESGFNPKAVSWAKAIGLTQITPLAEKQLMESIVEWPRYPGINSLSYLTLKTKIHIGEIDDNKEWRLDPEMSLIGGMTYIEYLQRYWSLESNRELVDSLNGNRNLNLTRLILASYNSGAARVKRAVASKKDDWQDHESLKEAVKYLRRVSSYCFHYTKKEVENDNET